MRCNVSNQMYKVFPGWAAGRILNPAIVLGAAILLSACSSGMTRLDYPAFGLADNDSTASLPVPSEPLYGNQRRSVNPAPAPDYSNRPVPLNNNLRSGRNTGQNYSQNYGQNNGQNNGTYNGQNSGQNNSRYNNQYSARQNQYGNQQRYNSNQGRNGTQGRGAGQGYGYNSPPANSYNNRSKPSNGAAYAGQNNLKVARLTEQNSSRGPLPTRGTVPQVTYAPSNSQQQPVKSTPTTSNNSGGHIIEVAQGQTLYGIAKAHGVSFQELKAANNLRVNSLKLGQRLVIPGRGGRQQQTAYVAPTKSPTANRNVRSVRTEPVIRNRATGRTYRVSRGDSLYAIAGRHGMSSAQLARHNGISQSTPLKPGQRLSIPKSAGSAKPNKSAANRPSKVTLRQDNNNAARRLPKRVSPSVGKFRWPVQGRIISRFGSKNNGTHNDGVNLAVPAGTSVRAADNGVVAYAGSELKGYGNLVLVRHANDWVSAYAHMDEIMVKRGDNISRGQVIAKSGKTGNVDRPQVHFELRKNSKPVNPLTHLASR